MNLGFKPIDVLHDKISENVGVVIFQPLERGYGRTLGNDLRRILLSSIPGASAIGIKVEGMNHEFRRVSGAANDVTGIIVSLKEMRFSIEKEGLHTVKFKEKKAGEYFAKDLELPKGVECLTPEVPFILLTGEKEVNIEIYIKKSRGYLDASEHKEFDENPDVIRIDGVFSPIETVSITVEQTRVGQETNFEKLFLEVETDGSINPKDAVMLAAHILRSQLAFIDKISDVANEYDLYEQEKEKEKEVFEQPIEILDLNVRPYNCLSKAGYTTIGKLLTLSKSQLEAIDQLGKKSIEEIIEKVRKLGYELKDE